MNYQIYRFFAFMIDIYIFILFARVISSWIRVDRSHPVLIFLYKATEPVLAPIRQIIPPLGMIDISVLVLFFALRLLRELLKSLLGVHVFL